MTGKGFGMAEGFIDESFLVVAIIGVLVFSWFNFRPKGKAKCFAAGDSRSMREIAEEYNDMVIYPDKVRLNCYYYRHYSFVKDIQMIFCTVLGRKMKYAGEEI